MSIYVAPKQYQDDEPTFEGFERIATAADQAAANVLREDHFIRELTANLDRDLAA